MTSQYELDGLELEAADVSGNGEVLAFDAGVILKYVGCEICNFQGMLPPNRIGVWSFEPESISYEPLTVNQIDQNYIGVIYGDVSTNWRELPVPKDTLNLSFLWTSAYCGSKFVVTVLASDTDTLEPFTGQGSIIYDDKILSIIEIEGLSSSCFSEGTILMAWGCPKVKPVMAEIILRASPDVKRGQTTQLRFEHILINEGNVWATTGDAEITFEDRKGDINCDGSFNILDVVLTIRHILAIEALEEDAFWRADCDGDGQIEISDVFSIVNEILKTGKCEP